MRHAPQRLSLSLGAALLTLTLAACGNEVTSEEQARRAYLGLDKSVAKALQLGFKGFNEAQSANIPEQTTTGDAGGTLKINGQVDQGSSANKGMRLRIGMTDYTDGKFTVPGEDEELQVTYRTAAAVEQQPALNLSMKGLPNATFTGTLTGSFEMTGDVEGPVTLNLNFAGETEDDGTGKVRRKAGTTTVTGTARAADADFAVNVKI
ncbi:MAG: hypothetical protein ACK4N5_15210 [Myxococcales bacterium]